MQLLKNNIFGYEMIYGMNLILNRAYEIIEAMILAVMNAILFE